jgi:hypothetical protein
MAFTQLNQLAVAFKKLSGKTHTNSNFGVNNESIGSSVQLGTSTIFGETIPSSPSTTLFSTSSGIVEKIAFELSPINLSIYTARTGSLAANTSSSIGYQGDGAPTLGIFSNGVHAYALKITSSYQANSNNPDKGTPPFTDGYHVSGSNGTLQLIPEQYGASYIATVKSGSENIAGGNEIDYYLDYYSGILFVQDYSATTVPTTVEAHIYIGKYADEVISSGSATPLNTGSFLITASNNSGNNNITFTKGDTTTFDVAIISSSYALNATNATNAQTASYVNTLNQDVTINGTVTAYTGSFNVLSVNYISSSIIYSSGSNTFGDNLDDVQILSGSVYVVGNAFTWNGNTVLTTISTASYATSASQAISASYVLNAQTASYVLNAQTASYVLNAQTASYVLNAVSASYVLNAVSASQATTASYVLNAQSASYVLNAVSASYVLNAQSASYVLNAVSASYVLNAQSASYVLNAVSASQAATASYVLNAQSASYVLNAVSASYVLNAQSASYVETAQTASYVQNAQTASYVETAQTASYVLNAVSASYVQTAQTASYVLNAVSASQSATASYVNTLNQDVTINGTLSTTNLTVTNDATITGNLTVNGDTIYVNVKDLLVEDKFILLNSGSIGGVPNEGGIIIQTGTGSGGEAVGTAFYYDQEANRWVTNRSSSVAWNATSSVLSANSDFIVTVTGSAGAPTGDPVNFGTTNYFYGQMYVQTDTSDIYIYA